MIQPNHGAPRATRRSPLTGGMLAGVLIALGAALNACDGSQPVGPDRVAPDRPSLALNPACDPGLGGQTHTDSILVSTTWTAAGNPHRVNQPIHIQGAGLLRLNPGTVVCFGRSGGLRAHNGGRVWVLGSAAAPVLLTAADLGSGWMGVHLAGTPSAGSSTFEHVRVEHTQDGYALASQDRHAVWVDSSVFRQNLMGVSLFGRDSRMVRSRVDTVTGGMYPAVTLGRATTFQDNVIRGAAGVGLAVLGTDSMRVSASRVEGSGGVGMQVTTPWSGFRVWGPVRVTGGATYPAEMDVSAYARMYGSGALQDSLLGNARDTLVVTGGTLAQSVAWVYPSLPWYVTGEVIVRGSGVLGAEPGSTLAFGGFGRVTATSAGRVIARGTQATPVLFTGTGWGGLVFNTPVQGQSHPTSYLTNVRVEGVSGTAVQALNLHPVIIDSAVFRQNGAAVYLASAASRLRRSRVDTTLISLYAAVDVEAGTLSSTLIRGSAGIGLRIRSSTAQILSCEIRESAAEGIVTWAAGTAVHNCNLVNNGGDGIQALNFNGVDAENNWWGDAAGPTGPNGDGVSGPVDYTPWRTTPYVLPYVP